MAEACKRLIKNCIICWNYLYLSQKLEEIKDTASREAFLDAVAHGSAVAWQHLNLLGEYDSRTRSCETASEFDPQNWWTKWGAILGVAQSPKILSIKGISEMACRVWYLCWNLTIVSHKWKGDARWCSASQGST
jgi:hypothetical protein